MLAALPGTTLLEYCDKPFNLSEEAYWVFGRSTTIAAGLQNPAAARQSWPVKPSYHQLWSFQPPPLLVLPASASAGPSSLHLRWSFQLPQTAGFPATQHWIRYGNATDTLRTRYGYATDTHRIHIGKLKQRTSCLVFGLKWS